MALLLPVAVAVVEFPVRFELFNFVLVNFLGVDFFVEPEPATVSVVLLGLANFALFIIG